MSFVRGVNPVWSYVDLTGKQFDDTFFMFVLQNELPYIPATVYQDPDGNVAWTNPIQFLANGTLPVDIYWDPNVTYRLEFRQGDTQQDPLIYLVENYVPGEGGSIPIDESSIVTDNQISNPQFALINFISPFTASGQSTQTIKVAPGWFLDLTGTGGFTLSQVPINNSVVNPTNAAYALRIQLNGLWSGAVLRQRFNQNGVLWSSQTSTGDSFVSSSITAFSSLNSSAIQIDMYDSQNHLLANLMPLTTLTQSFVQYEGVGQMPVSANSDFPPTAYIECRITLPVPNCDITLTSFQLINGDLPLEYPYEQTTYERQVDQTYHNSYPIVPIGTVIDYFGFVVNSTPAHYLQCNGATISRTQYQLLFQTVTNVETVTLTMGSPNITVANGTIYPSAFPVEGVGIPPGTRILSISGNVINLSANATVGGSSALTFFAVGNGDGSTTFNTPDLRGFVMAGAGDPTFLSAAGTGQKGGTDNATLVAANLPPHSHNVPVPFNSVGNIDGPSGAFNRVGFATTNVASGNGPGTSAPFSIIQATSLAVKLIRYE